MRCELCPHYCELKEGQAGFCKARMNIKGRITDINYGQITSIALDPIEKKPLRRFYPGSKIISVGSFGCNLRCPWCQNYEISMADSTTDKTYVEPQQLIDICLRYLPQGNIGLAFTYNEPFISYEYISDCFKLAKEKDLKTVIVTNGMINKKPLEALLPLVDALNIDLKGFSSEFYGKIGGNLETVKEAIRTAAAVSHVEVTTLVIPGLNDTDEEIDKISAFLADISPEFPLHISRFFPRYKMLDRPATPVETIYRLAKRARLRLRYVYEGNC